MGDSIRSRQASDPSFLKPTNLAQPVLKAPNANHAPITEETSLQSTVSSARQKSKLTLQTQAAFEPQSVVLVPTSSQPLETATPAQVKAAVEKATNQNYNQVNQAFHEDRHELNQRLQLQDPSKPRSQENLTRYNGEDVVVISFEGTGAFEPRRLQIMQETAADLNSQGLKSDDLFGPTTAAIEGKKGKEANWSGLNKGVHTEILKDKELQERTRILSFPSEESELFRGEEVKKSWGKSYVIDSLKDGKNPITKIRSEIEKSYSGNTPGIDNALIAMRDIQAQAKAMGKSPKFVVIGHSSGGRSMVKFLEKAKSLKDENGNAVKFELALSIDPVREAHEAALEGLGKLANGFTDKWIVKGTLHNLNRLIPFGNPIPVPKSAVPTIGFMSQPGSLYAPSNVKPGKYLSFHQKADTEGLGMGFGIYGSRVKGAINKQVFYQDKEKTEPLGAQGHGGISYSYTVKKAFTEGVRGILRLPY